MFPFKGAMKFLTAYFLGIIFFAIIYMYHPEDFHHSTSHLEPEITIDKKELLEKIKHDIKDILFTSHSMFKNATMSLFFDGDTHNKFKITIDNLDFSTRFYTSDIAVLHVTQIVEDGIRIQDYKIHGVWDGFIAHLKPGSLSKVLKSNKYPLDQLPECDENRKTISEFYLPNIFFNQKPLGMCVEKDWDIRIGISLNEDTIKKYHHITGALNGKGQYASGNHWRILYFSVTTITSLGYGDIVPLTNKMRAIVAFQTIFGIILLGAFLNSIASSRHK